MTDRGEPQQFGTGPAVIAILSLFLFLVPGCSNIFGGFGSPEPPPADASNLSLEFTESEDLRVTLIEIDSWMPPAGAGVEVRVAPGETKSLTLTGEARERADDLRVRSHRDCHESTREGCDPRDRGASFFPDPPPPPIIEIAQGAAALRGFLSRSFTVPLTTDELRNLDQISVRWPAGGAVWSRNSPPVRNSLEVSLDEPEIGLPSDGGSQQPSGQPDAVRIELREIPEWTPRPGDPLEVELSPVTTVETTAGVEQVKGSMLILSDRDCAASDRSNCTRGLLDPPRPSNNARLVSLSVPVAPEQIPRIDQVTLGWSGGGAVWKREPPWKSSSRRRDDGAPPE